MFQRFFTELRAARVPVSLKEYLVLVEALEKEAIAPNVEDFYYLSRASLFHSGCSWARQSRRYEKAAKDERNVRTYAHSIGAHRQRTNACLSLCVSPSSSPF